MKDAIVPVTALSSFERWASWTRNISEKIKLFEFLTTWIFCKVDLFTLQCVQRLRLRKLRTLQHWWTRVTAEFVNNWVYWFNSVETAAKSYVIYISDTNLTASKSGAPSQPMASPVLITIQTQTGSPGRALLMEKFVKVKDWNCRKRW